MNSKYMDISFLTKEEQENLFIFTKNLKLLGFDDACDIRLVKYNNDFVYDEDPSHPESHKAGDIRCRKGYSTNSILEKQKLNDDFETYTFPNMEDVERWLRDMYDICLTITPLYRAFGEEPMYRAQFHVTRLSDLPKSIYDFNNGCNNELNCESEFYDNLKFESLNLLIKELLKQKEL